jgi:hypothetical protein
MHYIFIHVIYIFIYISIYVQFLTATGAVCDQRLQNSFISSGEESIIGHKYKWNLLKVREEKYKGKHVESWKLRAKRICFCSSGSFQTYDNVWEGENKEIPIQ